MPNLAANLTTLFTEHEFLDRFAAAAGAGFQGVEFLFPYDWPKAEIADRLRAHGLHLALFNTAPGDWEAGERGIGAVPGREGEFRDIIGQALDYADALGCANLHVMGGVVPDVAQRPRMLETFTENLRYAAGEAARQGVRVLVEPLNDSDVPGYVINCSAHALALIDAVGSDNVFFQYDVYHMQIMEGDLCTTIGATLDRIRHIQIAAVPGRHEPDTGEINYPHLFAFLDDAGYDGWIGCEYRPRTTTLAGLGWAADWGIGG